MKGCRSLTNVVPTNRGFVFLKEIDKRYYLNASFCPSQNILLRHPTLGTDWEWEERFLFRSRPKFGLAAQIFHNTLNCDRVCVVWFFNSRRESILYITLFEWINDNCITSETSHRWPLYIGLQNVIHVANQHRVFFNYGHLDSERDMYLFFWNIEEQELPESDENMYVRSIEILEGQTTVLLSKTGSNESLLYYLETKVEKLDSYLSHKYFYKMSSWYPSTLLTVERKWNVYNSDLVTFNNLKTKINYYNPQVICIQQFPLPKIPFREKKSLEIILGGSRLFLLRSDETTILLSEKIYI